MVQQQSGSTTHIAAASEPCLNCGATLIGEYCAYCGQRSGGRIISLWTLLREFTGDLLNLDSRLWRSLLPLLVRPGFLTTEYLDGRRVQYFPPLRLYLVLSLIFLLLSNSGDGNKFELSIADESASLETQQGVEKSNSRVEQLAEEKETERNNEEAEIAMTFDDTSLEKLLTPELAKRVEMNLKHNPQRIADAFFENLPVAMLLFLPLIALFVRLLYIGSSRYFVEDLLFFVHFHSSAFLLLSLGDLLTLAASGVGLPESAAETLDTVVVLYVLVYLFLAMRSVYGKRLLTLRYLVLILAYAIGIVMTLVFTAAYSALLA